MKILVIRLGAMGDLIHVSPSLSHLKNQQPDIQIDFLTSPLYEELAGCFTGVSHVHTWDKSWQSLFALGKQLDKQHYDTVINLHPSFKTWALVQLINPKQQAVYKKEKLAVTGQAQRGMERRHAVRDFYEPFKTSFPLEENPVLLPHLPLADIQANTQTESNCIGIIPGVGGKRGNRAWLPEHYKTLIEKILADKPGTRIILFGGPDETALADQLAAINPQRIENTCGKGSIVETAQRMKRCSVIIGGDTGPLHLAAAVAVPIIQLFGPTSVQRTGAISTAPVTTLTPNNALDCWPCELPTCPLTGNDNLACMKQITVETVLQTLIC